VARVLLGGLVVLALSCAGTASGVLLAGSTASDVGPFQISLAARPTWSGDTTVHVPPLGTLAMDTHDGLLGLDLRAEEVDLADAEAVLADPSRLDGIGEAVAIDLRVAVKALAVRTFAAAVTGAVVLTALVLRRWRAAVAAALIAVALMVGNGGVARRSWRPQAVAEPRYTGLLASAPQAVGDARLVVERFDQYRAQVAGLVANVTSLYGTVGQLSTFEPNPATIRVLHVSDLHLNPEAFDVIDRVVKGFDVDVVVDTGDINDWGTGLESRFVERISGISVPYVFVRGNHDSADTERAVARNANAIVLDDRAVDVAGLRIWGIGDPRFTPDKRSFTGANEETEAAEAFAPVAATRLRRLATPPDIALVHDPVVAERAGGLAPLFLAGHRHVVDQRQIGSSLLLVEGSTGGAGLRGLQKEDPVPLSLSVLYLDRPTRRLQAVDHITVGGLGLTSVQVDRKVIPPPDAPGAPPPAGAPRSTTSTVSTTAPGR